MFATPGADTSLRGIAKAAGVGVGTIYRRFPSRDDLVETIYRTETENLGAEAAMLLGTKPPMIALREWMDGFVQFMFTKQGMADALPAILGAQDGRSDIPADDIMLGLGGITLIASHERDTALADRLIELHLDALRSHREGPLAG